MKKIIVTLSFCLLGSLMIFGQNTVGLLSYKPALSSEGYNLIYPHNQPNVYLLNSCGEVVHEWTDDVDFRPGNTAYLQKDGSIIKTQRPASVAGDVIWAGGGGGTVEAFDWDNNLLWSFTMNDELQRLHHDIAPMPNGNVLMIAWELKTKAEAIAAGRDTALLSQDVLWPEKIIEYSPAADAIVWEWHAWDHLVQDFDDTKLNFGVVADNSQLIDLNYDTSDGRSDWHHANSLDYNEELDQILISIPTFSEIWIIDHSTTTEQARGHTGGKSNRGGDLMYRFGNPLAYQAGTIDDQQLFYQHDAHWVDDYLPNTFPHLGKIAVFNNRVGVDFSSAHVLIPPWNMYKWRYDQNMGVWGPNDFDLNFQHPVPTKLHSTGLSSVQLLPNGNSLICSGRYGYTFEMTPANEIVWEYKTPIIAGALASQGDSLVINNNLTFRLQRIPLTDDAFVGRDLSPLRYLELNPNEKFCPSIIASIGEVSQYDFKIYPNPADDMVVMEWNDGMRVDIEVFDLLGRKMENVTASGGRKYLDVSSYDPGIYLLRIGGMEIRKLMIARE